MISQVKQKGFTIVELLIVIVVIAILAAISVAAYTSITARGNTSSAAAAAKAVKDVAETYKGANGSYPTSEALFKSGGADPVAKLPADITMNTTPGTNGSNADPKAVQVVPHGSPIAGFTITHRDFTNNTNVVTTTGDVSGTAGTAF